MLLYASNRRLEGWGSLDVGGPVELLIWRSVSSLETAPMWVSPTQINVADPDPFDTDPDPAFHLIPIRILLFNLIRIKIRLFSMDPDPFRFTVVMFLNEYFSFILT